MTTRSAVGVSKCLIRVGTGAVAGVASGTISETGKAINGEDVSVKSFGKAIGIGVLTGGIGGAVSHSSSNIVKIIPAGADEIAKDLTKATIVAGHAAVEEVTLSSKDDDPKIVALNIYKKVLKRVPSAMK